MIITANTSALFLLVITTTVLALIHLVFKPYSSNVLNIFDGIILQMMIIVSTLPLVDSFNSNLLLVVVLILLILPLVTFAITELIVHRQNIIKITTYFRSKPVGIDNYNQGTVCLADDCNNNCDS